MTGFDFVLGGRYRLQYPLGEGGMASVYAAVDERLGRSVAIKILSDSLCSDESFVRRFQHEAEAAARLSHPNIVSVYDVGADQGRRFIVMELIADRNLKDLIRDRGPLSMEQLVAIGAEILDGLGYAHQHGLIHRDIKPQNILISREGTPKLADFGIAKAVEASSTTQTAMVLGSVHYLAPEVAAGEPASIRWEWCCMRWPQVGCPSKARTSWPSHRGTSMTSPKRLPARIHRFPSSSTD